MLSLDDLRLIRAIGAAPSLAAAAQRLDLTPPAVTIRLQRIEERLGVRLAVRQSRGISLTDEGQRLHQEAMEILERMEALPSFISGNQGELRGKLRVVAPFGFGRKYVAPIVREFHRAHANLEISLYLSESPLADASGADVVVTIGKLKSSSWIAHPLAPNDRILCASAAYARRLKNLDHPSDLTRFPCLCLKENDEDVTRWRFHQGNAEGGDARKAVTIRVSGILSSNDGTIISDWALAGLGIVERSEWDVAPWIASGKLVRLLPDWSLPAAPVMALLPSRTGVSIRQRAFLDAARKALSPPPWRR
ncbi:DNA-binding transcriptional regulator, LysR family [Cupriavidus sp. YR651]|uniref:LysR family transcriptional regulator n=1 Tax=Cupriavidus sp. YR651 TaxID=1855315 RepID=UPI00087E1954|nr:LysR family transcriptional regulator [Cupriavidus sp. YR651]SDC86783.1 DNA-binding transcriptional regulator, LysR family [Cupriavidus sp. YR651]